MKIDRKYIAGCNDLNKVCDLILMDNKVRAGLLKARLR